MSCALLGGWLLVYLIVWRGLHQSGYIIWFTALFPYTVMSVLLIRAVTLPGAVDGLLAYIDVRMPKITCMVLEKYHRQSFVFPQCFRSFFPWKFFGSFVKSKWALRFGKFSCEIIWLLCTSWRERTRLYWDDFQTLWVACYIIFCRLSLCFAIIFYLHFSIYLIYLSKSPIGCPSSKKLENDLWHFLEFQIDWTYMKKGSTWIDAATQIFFAYSVGVGALPALGSYNRFNHNCFRFASICTLWTPTSTPSLTPTVINLLSQRTRNSNFSNFFSRDAVITCIVNTCTCLTAGVLVFSCLGYMAHLQGVTVHDVARSGPGLVFLTYPELVLSLPGSFIWAILFFAMLLVLGVDTEFCSVESLITGIVDNWSDKLLPHRKKVALAICVSLVLAGLTMCTNVSL